MRKALTTAPPMNRGHIRTFEQRTLTMTVAWLEHFANLTPPLQALVAGLGTLMLTAVGAGLVTMGRLGRGATFDAMLGFASGIMLAASYWSLLEPVIAVAAAQGRTSWASPTIGLLAGAAFLA